MNIFFDCTRLRPFASSNPQRWSMNEIYGGWRTRPHAARKICKRGWTLRSSCQASFKYDRNFNVCVVVTLISSFSSLLLCLFFFVFFFSFSFLFFFFCTPFLHLQRDLNADRDKKSKLKQALSEAAAEGELLRRENARLAEAQRQKDAFLDQVHAQIDQAHAQFAAKV